ncbi:hypothetical protein ACJJTC_001334 [Scirpophaga incertulas]
MSQQPKSTYLLLGNVSLADTIIGISIIFGASVENTSGSNQLCIFQLGMLVCPAMVSIFSVGFIAIDRYIYILHGLYYQRWFNTTRVRIGIVCIWIIGVTLGFMPVTGWTNKDKITNRCFYIIIYPASLVLFNSIISIIPIVIVAILYLIILLRALKNLRNIKATENSINVGNEQNPKLRIYRGNTKRNGIRSIDKSASFTFDNMSIAEPRDSYKSKSADDLSFKPNEFQVYVNKSQNDKTGLESKLSISTVESSYTIGSSSRSIVENTNTTETNLHCKTCKIKGTNKCRAMTIVILTFGSFVITWLPFFFVVIFYEVCENKLNNPHCWDMSELLNGPLATLALFNSVLNPMIYAWWHKGFKKSIKSYYKKYIQGYFKKDK